MSGVIVPACMGAHKDISPFTRLEVVEFGRRRRWTEAEKLRIVAQSMAGRRQVSATARRHGISRSQLHKWRQLAIEGRLIGEVEPEDEILPRFAPVTIATDPSPGSPAAGGADGVASERIEIVLLGGRRLVVSETVDAAALARIIAAAERA